jgi:ribosomal protein L19E
MSELEAITAELRALRRELRKLRRDFEARDAAAAGHNGAVKRRVAAKMMGIGRTKLDNLIASGDVRTAVDTRLVPLVRGAAVHGAEAAAPQAAPS